MNQDWMNDLSANIIESLQIDLSIDEVLNACEVFAQRLRSEEELKVKLSKEVSDPAILEEIAAFCDRGFLINKIEKEIGGLDSYDLRKQSFKDDIFESYAPLGTLVHVTPSNSEGLSFLAAIEGLLALNTNLVKISSRDSNFASLAMEALCESDPSGKIKRKVGILKVSSKDKKALSTLFSVADGVSAWGGEGAISEIQKMTPMGARFIPWGHKISFAYVDQDSFNSNELLSNIAFEVVSNEQQACSSPQVLYLETDYEGCKQYAQRLFEVIKTESDKKKLPELDIQERAEITNQTELARLETPMGLATVFEDEDKNFRLIVEKNPGLRPSPLFRTLIVKPLQEDEIVKTLHPWRTYLQTVGLSANRVRGAELAKKFLNAGCVRVTKIGEMLSSYEGEPHDGVYALTRFMRRVRADISNTRDIHRLSEFDQHPNGNFSGPIMEKPDFQKLSEENIHKAELFFRSGGSSGKTALSLFSYNDYNVQMKNAAEGLFAAGLDPRVDRVMNLFFGGGLYGGFVSFFTILEHLEAVQLPMAAHEDLEMVGEMIVSNEVNTLVGMPSYMIQLIKANLEKFKKYGKLEKIFFGGEHFSEKQRLWIKEELGVEVIRSAAYGSVDAGPLGFQCPCCEGSVHHLLSANQSLEILKIDSDEPCAIGETGRLVFTSKNREVLDIKRYDLGDLGRWMEGDCDCGRKTPRFELQGRSGDIFRAGGTFVNFKKIEKILIDSFDFSGESQILISNDKGKDEVRLNLDSEFSNNDEKDIFDSIIENYSELFEAVVKERGINFEVRNIPGKSLQRTDGSGKLIRVKDLRGS